MAMQCQLVYLSITLRRCTVYSDGSTDKQFSWTLTTVAFSAFILAAHRAVSKGNAMSIRRNIQGKKKRGKPSRKMAFKHEDLTSVHARKTELLKLSSKYIMIAHARKHTIKVEPVIENRN